MKSNKRERWIVVGVGAAFVVALLTLSNIYNPSPKLTTPEQDAQLLAFKAETIRTEIDLRNLEKLAYEYEIAYKHSYNGAKALYFKSLVEPIIIAAGDRREEIRREEDYLAGEVNKFKSTLNDVDEAWRMPLGTTEEGVAIIVANDEQVAKLVAEIEALELRKQELGAAAWSGSNGKLDESCLKEIGKVEDSIVECNAKIKEVEHKSNIVKLAYRLQRGEELSAVLAVVVEECCECCVEE